nr:MAG TPA: hypothetical protein [Caudoviricetes sp.]
MGVPGFRPPVLGIPFGLPTFLFSVFIQFNSIKS